jgi:hypothetical protein
MNVEFASLRQIETELKKSLTLPIQWEKDPNKTKGISYDFIYEILYLEDLIQEFERQYDSIQQKHSPFYSILYHWYNYWSGKAIEKIWVNLLEIKPLPEPKYNHTNLLIYGIPFNLKCVNFPKSYTESIEYAVNHPAHLVDWLWQNQMSPSGKAPQNQLFMIFYAQDAAHWKLKAELRLSQKAIENYIQAFSFEQMMRVELEDGFFILTDIVWIIN